MSKEEVLFMHRNYGSIYANNIKQFVDMKRALGFDYRTSAGILFQMDQLAQKLKQKSPGINKLFADKWGRKQSNESSFNHYARVRLLAQFSSFLCDQAISSFIPKLPPYPKGSFVPYIYSEAQLSAIFAASDNLRLGRKTMSSCLLCFPALIRLLYGTGIRISEALFLENEHVNLCENYIIIKDVKNGQERMVPISLSLVKVLKEYLKYRQKVPLLKPCNKFFINLKGQSPTAATILNRFKECLRLVNIPSLGRGQGPRLHDLRHTFAVNSLANMAETGIDLYASLPILSTYLGHRSLSSTDPYVRLTATMFPSLLKNVDAISLDVFPKFYNYEAN